MKIISTISQRLIWKLLLSHLIILLVGGVVLTITAQLHAARTELRHEATVQALLETDPELEGALRSSLMAAVNESVTVASVAAFLAAILLSVFLARRIVIPIQQMKQASQLIASGNYRERVPVAGEDELGKLAETFNQMTEIMEQTEQRRLELIGNVAHELRTPLSSLKIVMEGLLDGVLPAEPATYTQMQREYSRLERLIDDLQELSRIEADQFALNIARIDLTNLINTAVIRLQPQFEDKGVGFVLDAPDDLPQTPADADRIYQVLINLLGNALQYTPAGGRVKLKAHVSNGEAIVSVTDTGIGIAAEHIPLIFERFYRVDKSRARIRGGSGIGLTIAKHLVEAHGGRISAASEGPGQGSTFTFTIPVR